MSAPDVGETRAGGVELGRLESRLTLAIHDPGAERSYPRRRPFSPPAVHGALTAMSSDSSREITLDPASDLLNPVMPGDPEMLARSHRRLELLYDLGRALCRETGFERVVDSVLPALSRMIAMERGFVAEVRADGALVPLATHGIDLSGPVEQWPLSRTILERVLAQGVALLTSNAQEDASLSPAKSASLHSIRSMLAVPLGPQGAPTGILYADNRLRAGLFSEQDLRFVAALGPYVEIALRNARELENARTERERSDGRWTALQQESMGSHRIVGSSSSLRRAYERLSKVAPTQVPLLLLGETGTGKELFARAAHGLSERSSKVFMPVNVAYFTETLVESELFGHEKGAFTGATERKLGRLELADGGTLFLDEVAEIPLRIQAKLLRVLEDGEFERVGGTQGSQTVRIDVRLIYATNRDLEREIEEGRFREDLYYRVRGVAVEIPPLRERRDDIPEIVSHVLARLGSSKRFEPAALIALKRYAWPGNVRQLIRLVEEMDAVCDGDTIPASELPPRVVRAGEAGNPEFPSLRDVVTQVERQHIQDALEVTGGNNERAIELLGVSRAKYFDRKKAYGL